MSMLAILWYVLIAVLMTGYFVLDGFDLGVGVLYPFLGRDAHDRAVMRRAIGPVWDGNEVWLLTCGGALFAAFAPAYATSFSGFYLAIMLVLMGLILRAVSIEFAALSSHPSIWDLMFFIGSLLPALLMGVAVGNIMAGIPLDAHGDYTGTFFGLLTPFTLTCGALGLVHMLFQGSCWLCLKAPVDGALYARAARLRAPLGIVDFIVFLVATGLWCGGASSSLGAVARLPLPAVVFAGVYVSSMIGAVFFAWGEKRVDTGMVLLASLACVGLVGLMASAMFPNFIVATDPALSITVANAAGSDVTLGAMTVVACIGVPLVLIYHVLVYRAFRGRVAEGDLAH